MAMTDRTPDPRPERPPWLVRPGTIRMLWALFAFALAMVVTADLLIDRQGAFGLDGTIGFGAWFGFASCAAFIAVARLLTVFLKRRDDHYAD